MTNVTVDSFAGHKLNRAVRNKTLKLAQEILLKQTNTLIETGVMGELTTEEKQMLSLSDFIAMGLSKPKCIRKDTVDYYIEQSKNPIYWTQK